MLRIANNLSHKITKGPFPISGYISDVKVEAVGDNSCKVTWGCQFETEEANIPAMTELFNGFYNVIIEGLETMIKSQN